MKYVQTQVHAYIPIKVCEKATTGSQNYILPLINRVILLIHRLERIASPGKLQEGSFV